ncbi:MAG: hypothetical protein KJZ86_24420 [Caldilineaceae bacterium]|nr:hypothetical protein [Caldilineaceae bacterium]
METERSPHPFPPSPLLPSFFLAFRLVYIPASVLSHTGHGLPWLSALGALAATFGLEALTRRQAGAEGQAQRWHRGWFVVLMLFLLGLFPEEAPIGLLLWAAIGAAWARVQPGPGAGIHPWATVCGGLLGLTGLIGPGSWLLAGLLGLWLWKKRSTPD